ncbi:MAG: YggT family protein [Holosporaceae bacterium]|jgi:YggT family protein|nr:YggT family protein [Holosporaceae bacterium]
MATILISAFLIALKYGFNFMAYIVIADVVLSWLVFARILDNRNQFLWSLIGSINKLSNIILDPIRKKIPASLVFPMDLSPLFLLLLLIFLNHVMDGIVRKLL